MSNINLAVAYATDYLDAAVNAIDKKLGDGYAKKSPELVGAFMQAAATAGFSEDVSNLSDALRTDHPLQGETLSGISEALGHLAEHVGNISSVFEHTGGGAREFSDEEASMIAEGVQSLATHLKYLGVGDAATTMGAIEFLGTKVGEVAEAIQSFAASNKE